MGLAGGTRRTAVVSLPRRRSRSRTRAEGVILRGEDCRGLGATARDVPRRSGQRRRSRAALTPGVEGLEPGPSGSAGRSEHAGVASSTDTRHRARVPRRVCRPVEGHFCWRSGLLRNRATDPNGRRPAPANYCRRAKTPAGRDAGQPRLGVVSRQAHDSEALGPGRGKGAGRAQDRAMTARGIDPAADVPAFVDTRAMGLGRCRRQSASSSARPRCAAPVGRCVKAGRRIALYGGATPEAAACHSPPQAAASVASIPSAAQTSAVSSGRFRV